MISSTELEALIRLARQEVRDPRQQARFILREKLQERQLLHLNTAKKQGEDKLEEEEYHA